MTLAFRLRPCTPGGIEETGRLRSASAATSATERTTSRHGSGAVSPHRSRDESLSGVNRTASDAFATVEGRSVSGRHNNDGPHSEARLRPLPGALPRPNGSRARRALLPKGRSRALPHHDRGRQAARPTVGPEAGQDHVRRVEHHCSVCPSQPRRLDPGERQFRHSQPHPPHDRSCADLEHRVS